MPSRRQFLQTAAFALPALSTAFSACSTAANAAASGSKKLFFDISLAEWSFHKALYAKKMTNLDFPVKAKKDYDISIVEYVNQFFKDKAQDAAYLKELMLRCNDNGVMNHLIMIDGEGFMGDADAAKRQTAVENHFKWVECAKTLGCKTIRVNAHGEGTAEEVAKRCVESLQKLSAFGKTHNINVIVENHGGYSSNGEWLTGVMKQVGLKNCGTLPDFGNFCLKRDNATFGKCLDEYDRYKGTNEMMPFAKGVSAKSHDFNEAGDETHTDYVKMLKIVKDAGFRGIIGIEYEGTVLDEEMGVRKTLELLKKAGAMV
jgi:sugar phosphate isomerase/epimerase